MKSIFDWLNQITLYKNPPTSFSEEDWALYNPWLVNKFVSMNPDYLELANYLQKFSMQNKQQHYAMYRELVPKRKVFLKYIKSKTKHNEKLANQLAKYFNISTTDAYEYIGLLGKDGCKDILGELGFEDKEITKLWSGK